MARSTFLYVTYIRTTQQRLWDALTTDTEFMKQHGFGVHCASEWTAGVSWRMLGPAVRLQITHTLERDPPKFIEAVSGDWPKILSNFKSLLEGGTPC